LIGRLTGRIVEEGDGGTLVLDVGGVGYEVLAPLGLRGRLEGTSGEAVTVHVHTHVREDALQLFAFASQEERDAFRVIIGISNVGPKLGLALLGSVTVHDLAETVARGDGSKLTAIPGVGKKTAERLVLELKGKLAPTSPRLARAAGSGPAAPLGTSKNSELLLGALTRMGYRPNEAERAIASLASSRDLESEALGELVREALAVLAR
jgi:Holliday junction DNA helicase RuvA